MPSFHQEPEVLASAIRSLLLSPLLVRSQDEDMFRTVAIHRGWLARWFEDNLGWQLQVDVRAGIARLHKRTPQPDARRGLRRAQASRRPFDPFRYQLIALSCAQLLRRPLITLGDLADAVMRICGADERLRDVDLTRHADRVAFVDGLLWLVQVGAVDVTAGEVEGFSSSGEANAVLRADTTLIPLLLSSDTPPSRILASDPSEWIERLSAELKYGTAASDPDRAERDQRARWARHHAMRRLLDDPVLELDELPPAVRDYLFTAAGRDKVLSAVSESGLSVERHSDVWLAIDDTGESSVARFASTGRPSTTQQAAAIVLGALVSTDPDGRRALVARTADALERTLQEQMDAAPGWARSSRARGVDVLCRQAIELLEEFGLARRDGDTVVPRTAAARFELRIETSSAGQETLQL